MLRLVADLQSVRHGNQLVASVRQARSLTVVGEHLVGGPVLVEDGEGQSCLGLVVGLRGPLVDIQLDLSSWRTEDDLTVPSSMSGDAQYQGWPADHQQSQAVVPTLSAAL